MNLMRKRNDKSSGIVLLVILFFLTPLSLSAQEDKLTLDIKNGKVETFIKQVESQTHYTFVYRNMVFDPDTRITIVCKDKPILQVLDEVFGPLSIRHTFDGRLIILTRKPEENLLGAYSDAETASFAPLLNYLDAELLRQKTHLPSTHLISFVCQPETIYDWHNCANYAKTFSYIQGVA